MNNKTFLIIIFIVSFLLKILKVNLSLNNLPTLILSSLIPILLFLLIKEIDQKSEKLAFISAIILTLNPYNIYFSENTFRSSFSLFLLLITMWLLSKYFHIKKNKFLIPILIIIPLIFSLIFIDHSATTITKYFNYFSPDFLILGNNFNPRHGVILYSSLLFLVLGIFISLSQKKIQKINLIFFIWLLTAPISKVFFMSIPLVYFISLGIYFILNKNKSKLIYFSIIFIYLLSFIYYLHMYIYHFIK